jgi:hypothetical protein
VNRPSISARDARALRIGAVVVFPVLVIQFVIRPYQTTMAARKDELRVERALLARELRVLQDRARFDTLGIEAARLRADTEGQIFVGVDEMSASAALTRYISDRARHAPVLIQQVETQSAQPLADELVTIDVHVRGESDLEGILTFLRGVEFGSKLLTMPAIRVEPVGSREPDADRPTVLGFSVTLRGYVLLRATPSHASPGP